MARIDQIRELVKEYATVKGEVAAEIEFENEENLLSATATVFIQLQRLPKDFATPVTPAPQTTGEFQTADKTVPKPSLTGYNADKKRWSACPSCGKIPTDKENQWGKKYQACFDCKLFLNFNGTTSEIKPKA